MGKIHTLANDIGKGIDPLLCYSEGHHLRVFVKLIEKNDIKLKWINLQMKVIDEYEKEAGGPMWVEKIIQKDVIPTDCDGKLGKFSDGTITFK